MICEKNKDQYHFLFKCKSLRIKTVILEITYLGLLLLNSSLDAAWLWPVFLSEIAAPREKTAKF